MGRSELGRIVSLLCIVAAVVAPQGQADLMSLGVLFEPSHASDTDPDYGVAFPDRDVLELEIDLGDRQSESEGSPDPFVVIFGADVHFRDLIWSQVQAVVPVESWDAWQIDSMPFPIHLRFSSNAQPEQRFYGFSELELLPLDPALAIGGMKHVLDTLRRAGIPTRQAAISVVTVHHDGRVFPMICTLVEPVGSPLLDSQYDEDDGALFAVEGVSSTLSTLDPDALVLLQPADEEWDAPSPAVLFDLLRAPTVDRVAWRTALEQVFDVYEFLRLLAARVVLGTTQGYGRTLEPVHLYWDPGDERFHWIPSIHQGSMPIETSLIPPIALDLSNVDAQWLLLQRLAEDPAYFATYLGYVEEALRGTLDVPRMHAEIRTVYDTLIPLLERTDPTLGPFLPSVEEAHLEMERLLAAVEGRFAIVETFVWERRLRPSPIVISELHYNPSLDQGIDNNFEFVELYNRGSVTVDLTGYRFIEGLEFALPPGTKLAPGQCLLISKRAQTYRDAPCEVQQWARGSLSNGGEVVRLLDREGVEVDSVKYDDVAPWPEQADAGGSSLEVVDPARPNFTYENWRASEEIGGSPGWVSP